MRMVNGRYNPERDNYISSKKHPKPKATLKPNKIYHISIKYDIFILGKKRGSTDFGDKTL